METFNNNETYDQMISRLFSEYEEKLNDFKNNWKTMDINTRDEKIKELCMRKNQISLIMLFHGPEEMEEASNAEEN